MPPTVTSKPKRSMKKNKSTLQEVLKEYEDTGVNNEIDKETYTRFFKDGTHFQKYTTEMLSQRSKAKVFLLGTPEPDMAGSGCEKVRTPEGDGPFNRMNHPTRVDSTDTVVKMCTDRTWTYFMTDQGKVFFTGPHINAARALVDNKTSHQYSAGDLCPAVEFKSCDALKLYKKDYVEGSSDSRLVWQIQFRSQAGHSEIPFTEIHTAKELVYAIDSKGKVRQSGDDVFHGFRDGWSDHYYKNSNPLYVQGPFASKGLKKVLQDSLKYRSNYFIFAGSTGPVGPYSQMHDENWPIKLQEERGTGPAISDWVNLGFSLLCLRTDGTVELYTLPEESTPNGPLVHSLDEVDKLEELNKLGPFVQMSAFMSHVSLVTSRGDVVSAGTGFDEETEHSILQGIAVSPDLKNIAAISIGSAHSLALTTSGEVYSWGEEYELNGCLGLGTVQQAAQKGAKLIKYKGEFPVDMFDDDYLYNDDPWPKTKAKEICKFYLAKPAKMKLPGKAYAIAAGRDISAVLVYVDDDADVAQTTKRRRTAN